MSKGLYIKDPVLLLDFNEVWNFSKGFRKCRKYQVSSKSVQWEPSCSMQTDSLDEANNRFSHFADAPQKHRLSVLVCPMRELTSECPYVSYAWSDVWVSLCVLCVKWRLSVLMCPMRELTSECPYVSYAWSDVWVSWCVLCVKWRNNVQRLDYGCFLSHYWKRYNRSNIKCEVVQTNLSNANITACSLLTLSS
jgi:hypothetical protein